MTIQYYPVENLTQVDFNYMFEASLDVIDSGFLWPSTVTTVEQKKQYYLDQLNSAFDGTWPVKADGEQLLMYKVTSGVQEVEFSGGYVDIDNCFRHHWFLTAKENGVSRNWLYTAENRAAKKDFYQSRGIVAYKVLTHLDSVLYRTMKLRAQTGNFIILDEYPTVQGDNPNNLVTLKISI